jgi:hypothetical protein
MAKKFIRGSIIEDAAAQLVAQIMTEIADAHIAPRDAEITSLRSQLEEARAKAIEEAITALRNIHHYGEYGESGQYVIDVGCEAIRALNGSTNKEGEKS